MEDLQHLEASALEKIKSLGSQQDLTQLRSELLGKKGLLGQALRSVSALPEAERPGRGKEINIIKQKLAAALDDAAKSLAQAEREAKLVGGRYDVTLPGRRTVAGYPHPLRLVEEEVFRCLKSLGFTVANGPLVEHDWYNFEALNIPQDHPARDMQDTFFLAPSVVLRTHTSNVQIRTMLAQDPPIRIVAPGMVFRNDAVDATHSPVFHQVEGLWIDEKATFGDLKGILQRFAVQLFGPEAQVRLRPSYFPFTEPSAEVDVGYKTSKGLEWLEVLGAGMVHPEVLKSVGYDPNKVQGFAFGAGIERIAMLRYGIKDIRLFYENDLRFLGQFGGNGRHAPGR
ncbi:MAG: phenylalanine--tRNA ligase subunit alpha [Myxococcota bacterium]|nr:phenylalanine--tRNA ligase subunit alpha [Myxococcota bacterium]